MNRPNDVTALLNELSGGDRAVLDRLLPLVYEELHGLAHMQLRSERAGHTLNTTALVHEAYLKLAQVDRLTWNDRAHFFAVCAQAMRRILVNYARMTKREKRGGGAPHVPIEDVAIAARERPDDVINADQAIQRLEALNKRHARVVDCRIFGGMTIDETAAALAVSPATVKRDWTLARAWLNKEMGAGG